MMNNEFKARLLRLQKDQEELLTKPNKAMMNSNGIYERWQNPILLRDHVPLNWRYDFNPENNPFLLERIGVNATLNSGAILLDGKYLLVVRVEGNDRKSYFAIAESNKGTEGFRFWSNPVTMPETNIPDTNIYDMRLTQHEDGYIYGLFCVERKDNNFPDNTSAANTKCGIARTKDLLVWERMPDLITYSSQQRNVVLHPEFINGKYALYTRPQDGFINVGIGGGIGWGLTNSMENAEIKDELIIEKKIYHTINEVKNGQGPAPIKTNRGWVHLAHGVRNTAAGLRYVLYSFMTDLSEPWRIIHKPAGHLIAPEGKERIGDVSNVVFSNGWITDERGNVYIYYASSDTRMHVATSTLDRLIDYCINTPPDGLRSVTSIKSINTLISKNNKFLYEE